MKIKAKKTNSVSENAIRSSYFVIELRKLIHLSLSTLSANDTTAWLCDCASLCWTIPLKK